MFLKAPAAIIADGEAVRIPPSRPQIDWECELGVVIGRTAEHVPAARAATTSSATRSRTTCPTAVAAATSGSDPTGC